MPQEVSFAPDQIQPQGTPPPTPSAEVNFAPEQIQPVGGGGPPQPKMAVSHVQGGAPPAPASPKNPNRLRDVALSTPGGYGPSSDTKRMLGGAAGALGVAAVAPEAIPAWLASTAGAAAGGATVATAQGHPEEAGTEAAKQGAYEAGGQVVGWGLRGIGRRVMASSVGKAAVDKIGGMLGDVSAKWDALRGVAPDEAGRQVNEVAQGPAKRSLDQLGQHVEEAAKTGPPVDWTGVKNSVNDMAAKMQPVASHEQAGAGYLQNVKGKGGASAADQANLAQRLKDAGVNLPSEHPLPGVLSKIQEAPDQVSFEDAHKYKRMLDDATNWDKTARNQLQGITKATRTEVRGAMSGHEPYDQATAAYAAAVPLFRKGTVAQLQRVALENPEALTNTIVKGNQPTKLQMLFDVLGHHAEQGGGAAEGQAAKDSLRSAWTYKNLIQPGLDKFGANAAKMDPKFAGLMYGDQAGQQVLGNLRDISTAYESALEREDQFKASTFVKNPPQGAAQNAIDAGHVVAHPSSFYSLRALKRLATGGPSMADLVEFSTHSPVWKQKLIGALNTPYPGQAVADLMRTLGRNSEDQSGAPPEVPESLKGGPPTP